MGLPVMAEYDDSRSSTTISVPADANDNKYFMIDEDSGQIRVGYVRGREPDPGRSVCCAFGSHRIYE